jgi:hypothetical protein
MKTRALVARHVGLALRIQRLASEIEKLVPEVKAALSNESELRYPLAPAAQSLERAAVAIRVLTERTKASGPGAELSAELRAEILGGTSHLLSLFGSRVVLSRVGKDQPQPPSAGAQALAMLLEEPQRAFEAAEVAARLGCSVPIARTTLNRLVQSGHATRPAAGRFRAKVR